MFPKAGARSLRKLHPLHKDFVHWASILETGYFYVPRAGQNGRSHAIVSFGVALCNITLIGLAILSITSPWLAMGTAGVTVAVFFGLAFPLGSDHGGHQRNTRVSAHQNVYLLRACV